MIKKPTLSQRYNLRKTPAGTDQPTQKNSFRDDELSQVVQMNARVTPELKERVRIHCAITDTTYQEFFDEALNYYLDRNPAN